MKKKIQGLFSKKKSSKKKIEYYYQQQEEICDESSIEVAEEEKEITTEDVIEAVRQHNMEAFKMMMQPYMQKDKLRAILEYICDEGIDREFFNVVISRMQKQRIPLTTIILSIIVKKDTDIQEYALTSLFECLYDRNPRSVAQCKKTLYLLVFEAIVRKKTEVIDVLNTINVRYHLCNIENVREDVQGMVRMFREGYRTILEGKVDLSRFSEEKQAQLLNIICDKTSGTERNMLHVLAKYCVWPHLLSVMKLLNDAKYGAEDIIIMPDKKGITPFGYLCCTFAPPKVYAQWSEYGYDMLQPSNFYWHGVIEMVSPIYIALICYNPCASMAILNAGIITDEKVLEDMQYCIEGNPKLYNVLKERLNQATTGAGISAFVFVAAFPVTMEEGKNLCHYYKKILTLLNGDVMTRSIDDSTSF